MATPVTSADSARVSYGLAMVRASRSGTRHPDTPGPVPPPPAGVRTRTAAARDLPAAVMRRTRRAVSPRAAG